MDTRWWPISHPRRSGRPRRVRSTATTCRLADRLRQQAVRFIIEPGVRFQGQVGEQATMFFLDPSGNALEFKSFKDPGQVFAK